MGSIALSRRATKDIRRIGAGGQLNRIRDALEALGDEHTELDVKPLQGISPWLRLRVGEYRILYRPTDPDEVAGVSYLVARVVHRGDLERAVSTLA